MKKLLLLLAVLGFASCSSVAQQGKSTFTKFEGKQISGISVGGGWDVEVRQGNSTKVTITVPNAYKDSYSYELSNGIFEVRNTKSVNIRSWNDLEFKILVECSSLDYLDASGGVDINLFGDFKGDKLKVHSSGGADVKGDGLIICQTFDINCSGGADAELRVNASEDFELEASGGADLDLKINGRNGSASASGGADITLQGSATKVSFTASGGADLDAKELSCKEANTSASGAGSIKVNASERLSVNTSGAGSVGYRGNPQINSSSRDLRKID